MDTDAFSPFVSLDVDIAAPVCRLGILGGTRYADTDHARSSLQLVKRAVKHFEAVGVHSVLFLGDLLAAENAEAGSVGPALESILHAKTTRTAPWHLAFGPSDRHCFGDAIGALHALAPTSSATQERAYYAFFPAVRWRVLVLDASDPTSAGGAVGLGAAQLTWVGAQVSIADAEGERVIIAIHHAVHTHSALAQAAELQERVRAHPGVVALIVSLGDGNGWYSTDDGGVHHLSPLAAGGREPTEDAFGVVILYEDKLRVEMLGPSPDATRAPAAGWPNGADLALPRGGRLVSGAGDNAAFAGLLAVFFFLFHTLLTPLQPVLRLLSSSDAEEGDDSGSGGGGGGGGGAASDPADALPQPTTAAAAAPPPSGA